MCSIRIKKCIRCKKNILSIDNNINITSGKFYKQCIECRDFNKKKDKVYYEENKEKIAEKKKENKEKIAEKYKEYRKNNKEKNREYAREYRRKKTEEALIKE